MRKKLSILIVAILIVSMAITLFPMEFINARTIGYTYPTWCYSVVGNNVIGIGQIQKIIFWINSVPPTANGQYGDRWKFTVTVMKPDGSNDTIGPISSDPVGSGYTMYTPDQIGNYTVVINFPTTVITGQPFKPGVPDAQQQGYASINDTYLASTSDPVPFVAQQDPIPLWTETPLPSEYWNRPINSANINWYTVAGNWLGGAAQNIGSTTNFAYGTGPESAHVMWATPVFTGGLMDERFGDYGYVTSHYEGLSLSPFVLDGKVYFNSPNSEMKEGWYCLDLYTGKQLYFFNTTGPATGAGGGFDAHGSIAQQSLAFAQIYDPEIANQMGGYPYLWSTSASTPNTWMMYDAYTSNYICSINNVPTWATGGGGGPFAAAGGTAVYAKDGSLLRYNVVNVGTTAAPKYYLQCWNSTQAIWFKGTQQMFQNGDYSGFSGNNYASWRPYLNYTFDGSHGYSINTTIPAVQGSIRAVREDQYVIGGTPGTNNEDGTTPGQLWALNLDYTKGAIGSVLWNITFTPPSSAGNKTISMGTVDPEDGVFTYACTQTRLRWGYDLATGKQIWQSQPEEEMKYYGMSSTNIYQGMLLSYTYLNGGILVAYNIKTGEVLWKYEPTNIGTESPFGDYPIGITCIADGKIYTAASPLWRTQPLWRGSYVRCINASNGVQLWKVLHYGPTVVADGYLLGMNYYDNRLYCYGKGASALTVAAPDIGVDLGKSLVIHGTITDISAGTQQNEQANRFPNGVPAVSDDSQEAWMEYVYSQQLQPTNATGVNIDLKVLDANGNLRPIGTAVSDASGTYSFDYKPDVPGKYTVFATFQGSKSYWPSNSQAAFVVDDVTPQATQQATTVPQSTETLIIPATIAIIAAIAIVGAMIMLTLRKRA